MVAIVLMVVTMYGGSFHNNSYKSDNNNVNDFNNNLYGN